MVVPCGGPKCLTVHPFKEVQVGKDQEKILTPKTEVGKNQTNNQVLLINVFTALKGSQF